MVFHLGYSQTLIAFFHNRYDPGRPRFDKSARNEILCSVSRDKGRTWSEPRFVFAGVTPGGHIHSCSYIDMLADDSRIHILLGQDGRQMHYLHFDESDLSRFLTKTDFVTAIRESSLAK